MNPIALAGLYGFAKGFTVGGNPPRGVPALTMNVIGPAREELVYRMLPNMVVKGGVPAIVTSSYFALDHVIAEHRLGLRGGHALARFADVFAGGLLYDHAYKKWGLFGAIAAHGLHNFAIGIGRSLR